MDFKQNFKRTVNIGILRKRNPEIPDGLMKRCKVCRSAVFVEEARQNLDICPRHLFPDESPPPDRAGAG